jgi:hypothetical protein
VRRQNKDDDELYLFHGSQSRHVMDGGLRNATPLGVWRGGPNGWNWRRIENFLTTKLRSQSGFLAVSP